MQRQSLYPFGEHKDRRTLAPFSELLQSTRSGRAGQHVYQHPFFRHDRYYEVTGSKPIGEPRAAPWPHTEIDVRQSFTMPAPIMRLGRGREQYVPDLNQIDNLA